MDERIIETQQVIERLLQAMGFRTIVSVDDIYAVNKPNDEYVFGWLMAARFNDEIAAYSDLLPAEIVNTPSEEVFRTRFQAHWVQLETEKRQTILERCLSAKAVNVKQETEDQSRLSLLIPSNVNLLNLAPREWQDQKTAILDQATEGNGVLCLFDQNLSLVDLPETGGITLLSEVVGFTNAYVACGLLTQTIQKDDEMSTIREFADKIGLGLDQFLPLSKDRLRGDDPMDFADGLRMMWLNHVRQRLTREVKQVAQEAYEEADRKLNALDVYDFDEIVLRSSEREGVWEPETLFRFFEVYRRIAFRRKVFAEARPVLNKSIEQIRVMRNIATSRQESNHISDRVYQTAVSELYDDGQFLNGTHQPLEVGDIFEVGSGKYYILLVQPCDLMIRDGEQAGTRVAKTATLVKVQMYANSVPPKVSIPGAPLKYFGHFANQPDKIGYVRFRDGCQVLLDVLDLAVFNGEGRCNFPPDPQVTEILHRPWRERFAKLNDKLKNEHRQFSEHKYPTLTQYLQKSLRNRLLLSDDYDKLGFNLQFSPTDGFQFGLRRMGRYRQPGSTRLLNRYFAFLARDADEHDPFESLIDNQADIQF
jgi:hypothetical protein